LLRQKGKQKFRKTRNVFLEIFPIIPRDISRRHVMGHRALNSRLFAQYGDEMLRLPAGI
jgi:hypothetical protein